jgi:hypothetical protein
MTGPADARSPDESPLAARAPEEPDLPPRERRPWLERIGLAGIALVFGSLFAFVAITAWFGGEPFLAVMGGIGCLMTFWVGALTLVRG